MAVALKSPRPLSTLAGCQVRVYWNVTKKVWSVQYREAYLRGTNKPASYRWRVAGHAQALALASVHFEVSPAGRDRVRATGRKGVHAFALGTLVAVNSWPGEAFDLYLRVAQLCTFRVGYNPKTDEGFTLRGFWPGDRHVFQAPYAHLDLKGLLFIDRKSS
jgi:hypothetical protein